MTAEHREQIFAVVQNVVAVAKAYDAKGRSSMPIDLDEVTALMAAAHDFALFDQRIEKVLEIIQPIIDRTGDQIGTHALDGSCMEYHVGCLAVGIRSRLTAPTPVTEENQA